MAKKPEQFKQLSEEFLMKVGSVVVASLKGQYLLPQYIFLSFMPVAQV